MPDFNRDAVSASGIFVGSDPAGVLAGADRAPSGLPKGLTTRRHFRVGQQVTALVRLYRGSRPPPALAVRIRVLDANDREVAGDTRELTAQAFDAHRSADVVFALPADRLRAGPHLLRFDVEAAQEAPIRREMVFWIE
jgi:hypothetical protein